MKKVTIAIGLFAIAIFGTFPVQAEETKLDTQQIEKLTGLKGTLNEKEGVFKVSYPRSDITVSANGVKLTPPMGLTAWAAFTKVGNQDMVMGDMVMLEDQVNPVMSTALDNGLEVTALHNHFFWDSPKVMFMHVGGMGPEDELATAIGKVFAKIKETAGGKGETIRAELDPKNTSLSTKKLEEIIGNPGDLKDGVFKVAIGRTTSMHGQKVGNAMGINTWAAFIGSDAQALVDGDFAMLESELQDVLKVLRHSHINIVAIHNHMTQEEPRIIFLHYWGIGPAESLASGIKSALDKTAH